MEIAAGGVESRELGRGGWFLFLLEEDRGQFLVTKATNAGKAIAFNLKQKDVTEAAEEVSAWVLGKIEGMCLAQGVTCEGYEDCMLRLFADIQKRWRSTTKGQTSSEARLVPRKIGRPGRLSGLAFGGKQSCLPRLISDSVPIMLDCVGISRGPFSILLGIERKTLWVWLEGGWKGIGRKSELSSAKKLKSLKYNLKVRNKEVPISYGRGLWKDITRVWEDFQSRSFFKVANERRARYWQDTRCRHWPFQETFLDLFNTADREALVADSRSHGHGAKVWPPVSKISAGLRNGLSGGFAWTSCGLRRSLEGLCLWCLVIRELLAWVTIAFLGGVRGSPKLY
ncbi:hypothetical protein Acr_29g0011780 [Actinidia rufa]|uniref:Uncharacterized protein n=1 Tax=Actinidia rufa TaxID=165716 RepID=A0A7J0HFU7_9ERIC|nr:hypothetical protein Acr_29g0011780 [Actinidia rufa]